MNRRILAVLSFAVVGALSLPAFAQEAKDAAQAEQAAAQEKVEGYTDTPMQPNGKWRVHDPSRPQPQIITPPKRFSQEADAPSDAVVLFDGKDFSKWQGERGRNNATGEVKWKLENGYMETTSTGTIRTRDDFGDFQLHLEFATPEQASGKGQGRGNNGINIYGMYEIQVLDSYNNKTYPDGQASAIYGQYPPQVNASKPPGEWQTYDIIWEAPRWDESGKLLKKAKATVLHNGVLVHHGRELFGRTGHRALGNYDKPHPPKGFIQLYEHGNPVRFRNIWIRPIQIDDAQQAGGAAQGQAQAGTNDQAPAKDAVAAAVKKLSEANGYAWRSDTQMQGGPGGGGRGRFGGPTEGKAEKDGFTHLTMTRGDNTTEAYLKGDKGAIKTQDGWKSLEEAASDDGGGQGQGFRGGRFLARTLQNYRAPAAEAEQIAARVKDLAKSGDAYTGELTEEGAKDLLSFRAGRRGGGQGGFNPPAATNARGTVKFWVKDGVLSKYEYNVKGTMTFNENDIDIDRTTTVEIKDVGNAKVTVPDEVKGKVS